MTAVVTVVAMVLAGCHVSTSPQTVATLGRHKAPSMMRAPWNGHYTLYRVGDGTAAQKTVIQEAGLRKGDPLGFRVRESGVVAVAGDLELPLQTGAYQWVMVADAGQTDPFLTTALVVVIVVVAGAVVAVVVASVANSALHHYGFH